MESHKYFLFDDAGALLKQDESHKPSNFLQVSGMVPAILGPDYRVASEGPPIMTLLSNSPPPFLALPFFEKAANSQSNSRIIREEWVKQCASIAKIFSFEGELLKTAQNAINDSQKTRQWQQGDSALFVGVHIRRGNC
ncbi:MAG: hypothetical protein FD188_3482 [Ignavibacteria bacterium]|nr:MAG: hypothetical protein FD188_3482 [Ignavibacteria bacterium]